jgi:hypothetical protein
MFHKESVWLAVAVLAGAVLAFVVAVGVPNLADRLIDCPDGRSYSLRHGRCVGNLEFDRR